MTNVRIRETEDRVFVHMKGHAGYDSTRRDIVCASCSVLIQSLINSLHVMQVPSSWYQAAGEIAMTFPKGSERAAGALEMFKVGVNMLATSYPNNVKIEK